MTTVLHFATPTRHLLLHNIYQRLYYLPILFACGWYGLKGGLLTAGVAALGYTPHILHHWAHYHSYRLNQLVELAMFGVIGVVAGILSDREKRQRAEAERTAEERDRAYTGLRESIEKMRRADRLSALGTLAAGMAHEIRNPLGSISGSLEILGKEFPDGHSKREFVDILRREIARLSEIVEKYLDFARPSAPEMRLSDLNTVVETVVSLVQRQAAQSRVAFEVFLDRALPPLRIDPAQVQQAVLNLLINAVQAMPGGGVVEVRTGVDDAAATLTVRDHGPGLPDGEVERIFDPFYTTKPGGTGLGLAVAQQVVHQHGGALSAAAADGGGARFTLTLPVPVEELT